MGGLKRRQKCDSVSLEWHRLCSGSFESSVEGLKFWSCAGRTETIKIKKINTEDVTPAAALSWRGLQVLGLSQDK